MNKINKFTIKFMNCFNHKFSNLNLRRLEQFFEYLGVFKNPIF